MSDEIDFPKLDKLNLQKELVKKLTEASNLIKSISAPFRVISHILNQSPKFITSSQRHNLM